MSNDPDDILRKAEALLARHRAPHLDQPEPPVDFPTLTEVIDPAPPSPAQSAATMSEAELIEFERELRKEILQLVSAELQRLVEARLHPRIEATVAETMTRARIDLEVEIRRAVREAVTQVIDEEVRRLDDK